MINSTKRTIAMLTAVSCLGSAAWALGAGTTTAPSSSNSSAAAATADANQTQNQGRRGPGGPGGAPASVTGDALAKATAAVKVKVAGATIDRVHQDPNGYHAHITKSDGTKAQVQMDANFTVTSVGADTRGPGRGTPITGDTLAKVTAAIKAKLAGSTVQRVTQDPSGGYRAHVTKSDGTRVHVQLDKNFTVTDVREGGQRGPRNETPVTGEALAKATAAVKAKVAGATIDRVEKDANGYHAHVTKSDGTKARVQMDANFTVIRVDER